jgi:AraC-like DNA-binding protein
MLLRTLLHDRITGSELRISRAANTELAVSYGTLSIKYVLEGEERYLVNGRTRAVKAGTHLVVGSGGPGAVSIGHTVAQGLCVDLGAGLLDEVLRHHVHVDERVERVALEQDFFRGERAPQGERTTRLLHAMSLGEVHRDRSLFYNLAEAILLDRSEWHGLALRIRAQKRSTQRETLRKLLLARQAFEVDPRSYPTARSLAEAFGCTEFHFSRAFTQAFGASPYAYMLRIRLVEAQRQLATTALPVADIALHCGFNDAATFARAFRRCYGVAPSSVGDRARMVKR